MITFLLTSWWTVFVLLILIAYSTHVLTSVVNVITVSVFLLLVAAHVGLLWLSYSTTLESPPTVIRVYTSIITALCFVFLVKYVTDAYIAKYKARDASELGNVPDSKFYTETANYAYWAVGYIMDFHTTTISREQYKELLYTLAYAIRGPSKDAREKSFELLRKQWKENMERDHKSGVFNPNISHE